MISGNDKNSSFLALFDLIERREPYIRIHGLKGSSAAYLLAQVARTISAPLAVVTADEEKAERLYQELLFFMDPGRRVSLYPGWDVNPFEKISPPSEVMGQRWKGMHQLASDPGPGVVVASLDAVLQRVPPREILRRWVFSISRDQEFPREELIRRLEGMSYTRATLVTEPGEFAVRGHLVDFFSPAAAVPLRVEFSGDVVESLRAFDPDSQRSSEALERALILPVKEVLFFQEFNGPAAQRLEARLPADPTLREAAEEVLEKVRQGIPFPAVEFYLPYFYPSLESFFDYLPPPGGGRQGENGEAGSHYSYQIAKAVRENLLTQAKANFRC